MPLDLKGFKTCEPAVADFDNFHECYKVDGGLIAGCFGACWKLYTKEGYPLTRASHSFTMDDWGNTIISKLGSTEVEYDFRDLVEQDIGLRRMIMALIHKSNSEDD